jgi:predicted anti-sigma-YlaC factor YlaD
MLNCKDASHLISQRLDRPLGRRERWGLRMHLLMCRYCRRFSRQLGLIHLALRKLGRESEQTEEGAELSAEARERIGKALRRQQGRP